MNVQSKPLCGVLIVAGLAISGTGFTAVAENPPPVVVMEFEIDRQVDPVRYVQKAVLRNNVHRDTIMEFTATRTDLPDTRERWTVIFENDPTYEHIAHVEINGLWSYSSGIFLDANDDPRAEMSISGQTVSIDMAVPCDDPNFADYQAILAQTATERVVVDTVSGEVVSEMLDSWAIPDEPDDDWDGPDWPSWDDCISQCEDDDGLPSWCDGWSWDHPEMDCQDKETCCVNAAYLHRCRRRCTCDYLGHPNKQEDCYETAELALDMMKGECKKKFDECDKQCE